MASSGGDGQVFSNISATPAAFTLLGGTYCMTVSASFGGGNVQFNILSLDGVTWIPVQNAFTSNGFAILDLPPGQFQLAITTATAVYAAIVRRPA
jgi:hypothetical protein